MIGHHLSISLSLPLPHLRELRNGTLLAFQRFTPPPPTHTLPASPARFLGCASDGQSCRVDSRFWDVTPFLTLRQRCFSNWTDPPLPSFPLSFLAVSAFSFASSFFPCSHLRYPSVTRVLVHFVTYMVLRGYLLFLLAWCSRIRFGFFHQTFL